MKWSVGELLKDGDERVISHFLFLPTLARRSNGDLERRWLTWGRIKQVYLCDHARGAEGARMWLNREWVDE